MRFNLLLLFILFIPIGEINGQNECFRLGGNIDSVQVNFISLGEYLDINVMLKRDAISFVSEWGEFPNEQIYQTHSYDTIDYLFSRIKKILDNPPIYDTSAIINDCCHGMTFNVFSHGNVLKKTYIHYSEAYFPFAYAELYSLIRQILVKYRTGSE